MGNPYYSENPWGAAVRGFSGGLLGGLEAFRPIAQDRREREKAKQLAEIIIGGGLFTGNGGGTGGIPNQQGAGNDNSFAKIAELYPEFALQVMLSNAAKSAQDPSYQYKTEQYMTEDGRPMERGMLFNPKTGAITDTGRSWSKATDPNSATNADAVEILAQGFIQTGKFPSLGMGMGPLRAMALQRSKQMMEEMGLDPMELPGFRAEYESNSSALKALNKSYHQIMAFEETARRNLGYALELSSNYSRSGFPTFNAFMNAVKSGMGGEDIEAFRQAVMAASTEYMKVITSGSGISSAELSVRAQEEAQKILNAAKTEGQFKAIIDSMHVDMENRKDAYLEQKAELSALVRPFRNKGGSSGAKMPDTAKKATTGQSTTTKPEAKPRRVVRTGKDPSTGKRVVQYDDGSLEYAE